MRLKIRCDCTGDPPGELTTTATVGSLENAKAFSIGPATAPIESPGRSGVTMPMGPVKRSTGTTGPRLKRRIGRGSFAGWLGVAGRKSYAKGTGVPTLRRRPATRDVFVR